MSLLQPRENVLAAQKAMLAQSSIGIIITVLTGILQTWGFTEKYSKLRLWRDRGDRAIVLLLGLTASSLAFYIVELDMYAHNWIGNDSGCLVMGRPFVGMLYVTAKQFLYYFLFERAGIVLDALQMDAGAFAWYRRITGLLIIFGIPAGFYWTFFVMFYAVVFVPEGVCVYLTDNSGPIISFAVLDLALSGLVLVLFAYPLRQHLMKIRNKNVDSTGDKSMGKVLRKNLLLSVVIITATVFNLSVMAALLTTFGGTKDRNLAHWQIYATFFPSWDLIICLIAALWMNNAWMPKRVSMYFQTTSPEDHISDSNPKGGSKPESNRTSKRTANNSFTANIPPLTKPKEDSKEDSKIISTSPAET